MTMMTMNPNVLHQQHQCDTWEKLPIQLLDYRLVELIKLVVRLSHEQRIPREVFTVVRCIGIFDMCSVSMLVDAAPCADHRRWFS